MKSRSVSCAHALYKTQDQERQDISCICSDVVVTDILEPVANKQRLYMLQSLARQTMTFSAFPTYGAWGEISSSTSQSSSRRKWSYSAMSGATI